MSIGDDRLDAPETFAGEAARGVASKGLCAGPAGGPFRASPPTPRVPFQRACEVTAGATLTVRDAVRPAYLTLM